MRRALLGLVSVLVLLGFMVGVGASVAIVRFDAEGPLVEDKAVVVPRGGVDGIVDALVQEGVLDDPEVFLFAAWFTGADKRLRAGEYLFPARVSPGGVMVILESGKTVVRRITIAEGLTVRQVAALLEQDPAMAGLVGDLPDEGALLPETYHYSWGDPRRSVLGRMHRDMDNILETLWAGRAEDLPLDSPRQAVILASIVEKETGIPEERPRVAAVFLNRLRLGMRLQSDPTVVYGLTHGEGPMDRGLTKDDLRSPGPFNTYLVGGLPPDPICNPGRAALEAVLHPAATEDLYFVADGSGGHAFAKTLTEHNRNVANWRRIERARREAGPDSGT